MRRVRFEVPADGLDELLDGVMPLLACGLREVPIPDDRVELTAVGHASRMPSRDELEAAAGGPLEGYEEDEVPADWRARRPRTDIVVGDRLVLRAPHDPAPADGLIDIVLARTGLSFGTGSHPTTRMCAVHVLDLEPEGAFADIGCGLGTLAILAAKRGFAPVKGVDREPAAIEQAVTNAQLNGVDIDFALADVERTDVPLAPTLAVNAPPAVHVRVVEQMTDEVRTVIVSGTAGPETDQVVELYAGVGFAEAGRHVDEERVWAAVLLRREAA